MLIHVHSVPRVALLNCETKDHNLDVIIFGYSNSANWSIYISFIYSFWKRGTIFNLKIIGLSPSLSEKLWLFFFQNHYINGLSLPPLILIFSEMYIHIKSVVHCSWRLCSIKLMMTLDTEQCNLHLFAVSSNSHQVILQFKMSACGLLWQPFSIKSKLTLTLIHFKLLNATCANQYVTRTPCSVKLFRIQVEFFRGS